MHEFVISANRQKERGLKALDIAKNLHTKLIKDGFLFKSLNQLSKFK